jgi:DNA invertase Pin-like site-specific DNA recombinase
MNPNTSSRRGSTRRNRNATAADTEFQMHDNRCILYIRASTADQQHTLEAQAHEAARFAAAHGKVVTATYTDSGVSGSKPFLSRTEAKKAVAHLLREGIGTLLVMKLDRAFRNTVDMHQTVDHLLDKGITFRVANPDIDFKGPFGRLIATLLGAIAEFELGCRSERQRNGFDSMRRQRIARSQNAPFGWDIGGEIPGETSKSGKPYRALVPNPQEQATLRTIIEGYEDKRLTLQEICDQLNASGIKTKMAGKTMTRTVKGKPKTITISGEWKPATVKSVLDHADLAEDAEPSSSDS